MAALHLVSPQHDHDAVMKSQGTQDTICTMIYGYSSRALVCALIFMLALGACLGALGGVPRESRERQPDGQAAHAAL